MPDFTPIEPDNNTVHAEAFAALQAKYKTAGDWATWAETSLAELHSAMGNAAEDNHTALVDLLDDLVSRASSIDGYTPGIVAGYSSPTAPVLNDMPEFNAPVLSGFSDVPDYVAPTRPTYAAVPVFDMPADIELTSATVTLPTDVPVLDAIPSYTAPTMGTLQTIPTFVAPDRPTMLDVPTFAAPVMGSILAIPTVPDVTMPVAPDSTVDFVNEGFTDALVDSMRTRLSNSMSGTHTGLGDAEAALFAKEAQRIDDETVKAYNAVVTQFSARGFDMPTGALLSKITEMTNEGLKRKTDSSAAIMAESARLAQDFNKHVLSVTTELLNLLSRVQDNKVMRDFEAAKTEVQVALDVFKAKIEGVLAEVNLSKTRVDAVVAANDGTVKTFLGQLQAELEPIRGTVDVNKNLTDMYKSDIEAAVVPVKAIVDANRGVYDAFLAEVQAQVEPMKGIASANTAKADMYKAQVDAAAIPARIAIDHNRVLVDKYQAELQGSAEAVKTVAATNDAAARVFSAELDAAVAPLRAVGEANRIVVDKFRADIEGGLAPIKAVAEINSSKASVYHSAVQSAVADFNSAALPEDLKIKQADISIKQFQAETGAAEAAAKLKIEQEFKALTVLLETLKAQALAKQQVISSALGSVVASSSFGFSGDSRTGYDGDIASKQVIQREAIAAKLTGY